MMTEPNPVTSSKVEERRDPGTRNETERFVMNSGTGAMVSGGGHEGTTEVWVVSPP